MNMERGKDDMANNEVIQTIPEYIGIIMDGNRRWARENGLPISQGHREGVQTLRKVIKKSIEIGVKYLSVFTLSTDNRSRGVKEMRNLMELIKANIMKIEEFKEQNVQVRVIGSRENLSDSLLRLIKKVEAETADCTGLKLSLVFNYGGQDEIVSAFNAILADSSIEEVSLELFEKHLFLGDLPEPEVVIRTGGEKRTSGFSA